MKTITLLAAIILAAYTTTARIINIPADYPTIQEGINAAEAGDTVLVQPGTYFENIRISHTNNLTVASLYLTTGDPSYISQTIIDGGQKNSVVYFYSIGESTRLCGFTITNGRNSTGGGIYCKNAILTLTGLNIEYNSAEMGGGIFCGYQANLNLRNVNITYNSADESGGAIWFANDTYATFDSTERCNIYLNSAKEGSDLYGYYGTENMEIVLDTFTVLYPTRYHATLEDKHEQFIFNIEHGKIEQINADLYVSPDGDNNNSGLSEDDPLKTIYEAFYRILPDSTNPHTIYLAEGTYSDSTNGETFPVVLIDYITLRGTGPSGVVLDASGTSEVITEYLTKGTGVSGMTITGGMAGHGAGITSNWSSPTLKNLLIKDNHAYDGSGGGIFFFSADAVVENVTITHNTSAGIGGGITFMNSRTVLLKRTTISHNTAVRGGGLVIGANVLFDSIDRCNIYYNTATEGSDLFTDMTNQVFKVFVDTFSVLYPTSFYTEPVSSFNFDIRHGKIEQVNSDLFVSPNGDNNNSGLTEDEPLKTIHWASGIILADSAHPHTIHLQEGTYSPSVNGELFPLTMTDYISLGGVSRENVILNAEWLAPVLKINGVQGTNISDLTITGGKGGNRGLLGGGINCLNASPVLTNLIICDNVSHGSFGNGGGIYCDDSDPVLMHVEIKNNRARSGGGLFCSSTSNPILQDVIITGNIANYGGGIYTRYNSNYSNTITLHNVTLANNTAKVVGGGADFKGRTVNLQHVYISENSAPAGGGLCFYFAVADLDHVFIQNNNAEDQGGGIYSQSSNLNLKEVTIKHNKSGEDGGGLYVTGGCNIIFDSINRSNIYQNYAPLRGRDLYSRSFIEVKVDTFTVVNPVNYFAYPLSSFDFDIRYGLFEQVNADLYVSPQGDNLNSGLSSDEPLKNIDVAVIKIIPDTIQRTIHLLEGVYSRTATDEVFPFHIPEYIDMAGVAKENVILDAEGQSNVFYFDVNNRSKLSNVTVKGGKRYGIHCYHSTPVLENLLVTENEYAGIYLDNNAHAFINNVIITQNSGSGLYCDNSSSPVINHLVVNDNKREGIRLNSSNPEISNASISNNRGVGISCYASSPKLTNITISGNYGGNGHLESGGINCSNNSNPEITNAVISGNSGGDGGGIGCDNSNPKLTNVSITENESHLGGGLYCNNSSPVLHKTVIAHNTAWSGGGIYLAESSPVLSDVDIFENKVSGYGGGMYFINAADALIFDTNDRCNIYLNKAVYSGNDLFSNDTIEVVLDTFTVLYPGDYHASPIQNFSFDIRHGLLEQVAADLYVSPQGDNENSGLTAEEPIKNIHYAYAKLITDSLNPRTVHLLEGVYSPSQTGEAFPVTIPRYINLSGTVRNGVILDAEKQAGVIYVYGNRDARISDLTVTNGSNSGILLGYSHTQLKNLTVTNNEGSGIYSFRHDTSSLINVSIFNNQGMSGGGIYCERNSLLVFDETERCDIYNNRAAYSGNDIYAWTYLEVFTDTFSVLNPKNFHAAPLDSFAFDIRYGRFEQTSEDLYISPDGNNGNSGLTENEPIKNLHTALSKSLADSLHPQTFFLADGLYSPSATNEFFPVVLDDYIKLEGSGAVNTILDADSLTDTFIPRVSVIRIDEKKGINISRLTVTGGTASGISCYKSNPIIQDVRVTDNSGFNAGGIYFTRSNPVLRNTVIDNNKTSGSNWYEGGGGGIFFDNCSPTLINVSIINNEGVIGLGGGIYIIPSGSYGVGEHTEIINSILWNNLPNQIYVDSWGSEDSATVNISWSNIMSGKAGVEAWDTTKVQWLEGNTDEDPVFEGTANFPYVLSDYSPCIDAGTPDTSGLFLPPFDILGGPRIWNNRIDMGAVEWNSLGIEKPEVQRPKKDIWNYPNPFTTSTTITYELQEPTIVQITIYNHLGRQLSATTAKRQKLGEYSFIWQAGYLPSGVYYCVLRTDNGIKTTKMIKMK